MPYLFPYFYRTFAQDDLSVLKYLLLTYFWKLQLATHKLRYTYLWTFLQRSYYLVLEDCDVKRRVSEYFRNKSLVPGKVLENLKVKVSSPGAGYRVIAELLNETFNSVIIRWSISSAVLVRQIRIVFKVYAFYRHIFQYYTSYIIFSTIKICLSRFCCDFIFVLKQWSSIEFVSCNNQWRWE